MGNVKVEIAAEMLDEMVPNWFRSSASVRQCMEYAIAYKMPFVLKEIGQELLLDTLDDNISWDHEIEERLRKDRGGY